MTERDKLAEILENHKHWLDKNCAGWKCMRADLYGADLRGFNLRGVVLPHADLRKTDLYRVNLYGADLRNADLRNADSRWSDLRNADLRGTDLRGADLRGSDLRDAKLQFAILQGAKLPYIPYACPEVGAFTGFKKCRYNMIVELEIPADAKRLSATGRKCRCDKAKVVRIWNLDRTESCQVKTFSTYDRNFVYEVGKTVYAENFEDDRWIECAPGIHFFINFQEAVDY